MIKKYYASSSNSFMMQKANIVGWLNDRSKFSSTSSSSSTETSNIERSNEITDSMLERVQSLKDKVETVDSKLDIILRKLQ